MKIASTFIIMIGITISLFGQFHPVGGPMQFAYCHAVYADDDVVLASGGNHLYRSTDHGNTFSFINIDNIAIDPRCIVRINNTLILGAINGQKIYRSTDLGLTWQGSATGMPQIGGIYAPVPRNAVVVGNRVWMGGTNFFRYSDDEGVTWQSTTIDGLTYGISYTNNEVWVHNATAGSQYSTNGGNTWIPAPANPFSNAFATNGYAKTSLAFVAVSDASAGTGVKRSLDNGLTWNNVSGGLSIVRNLLQIGDTLYTTSFNGLRRSVDGGLTWTAVGTFNYDVVSGYNGKMWHHGQFLWVGTTAGPVRIDLTNDSHQLFQTPGFSAAQMTMAGNFLFATDKSVLTVSQNNGLNWTDVTGNIGTGTFSIEHITSGNNELFVIIKLSNGTTELLKTADGGVTFTTVVVDPAGGSLTSYITFNPQLIATVQSFLPSIRKSTDGGVTWSNATILNTTGQPATNSGKILHFTKTGPWLFAYVDYGFMMSQNDGDTWTWYTSNSTATAGGWQGRIVRNLFNAFEWKWEIRESTDGGTTWTTMIAGLPAGIGTNPSFGDRLFIVDNRIYVQIIAAVPEQFRFYYLEQNSSSWAHDPNLDGLPGIATMLIKSGQTFFTSLNGAGVWSSSGQTGLRPPSPIAFEPVLYPNPARTVIQWQTGDQSPMDLQIFDSRGRLIRVIQGYVAGETIPVADLPRGLYMLRAETAQHAITRKLILE